MNPFLGLKTDTGYLQDRFPLQIIGCVFEKKCHCPNLSHAVFLQGSILGQLAERTWTCLHRLRVGKLGGSENVYNDRRGLS